MKNLAGAELRINFYYAALYSPLAVILTFFPYWLKSRGLDESQIGIVMAAGLLVRVVVAPAIADRADRAGTRKKILVFLVGGTALATGAYFPVSTFTAILLAHLLVSVFSSSIMPLGESVVLPAIKRHGLDYGKARRWGSIAVIALSILLGSLVERDGSRAIIVILTASYLGLLFAAAGLPEVPSARSALAEPKPFMGLFRFRGYVLLLASAAVAQAAHAVANSYASLYWLAGGLSPQWVGWLWALGIASEIVVFSLSTRVAAAWRPATFLWLGCAAGIVRWTILSTDAGLAAAVVVQSLQGATLAILQIGVARFISNAIPHDYVARATGLYFTFAYGLLMSAFIFTGGLFYEMIGGGVFLIAATASAFAFVNALLLAARTRHAGQDAARP